MLLPLYFPNLAYCSSVGTSCIGCNPKHYQVFQCGYDYVCTQQFSCSSLSVSPAVPGGADFLPAQGSEDAQTEGASLPAQVHPQHDRSVPAGWLLLPNLFCHEKIAGRGETLMLIIWFWYSVTWIW